MDENDLERIISIAKNRVEKNENLKKYDGVKQKLDELQDFKNWSNNEFDKGADVITADSIESQLNELKDLFDIQTRNPIKTGIQGFAKPLALKIRSMIQNEIRFTLDPIVNKQVSFNSKILNLLNDLNAKYGKLIHQIITTSIKHQDIIFQITSTSPEFGKNIDQLSISATKHTELLEHLNNAISEHRRLIDEFTSTSAKHQELMDSLSSTSVKYQESINELRNSRGENHELFGQLGNTILEHEKYLEEFNKKLGILSDESNQHKNLTNEIKILLEQHQQSLLKSKVLKSTKRRIKKTRSKKRPTKAKKRRPN